MSTAELLGILSFCAPLAIGVIASVFRLRRGRRLTIWGGVVIVTSSLALGGGVFLFVRANSEAKNKAAFENDLAHLRTSRVEAIAISLTMDQPLKETKKQDYPNLTLMLTIDSPSKLIEVRFTPSYSPNRNSEEGYFKKGSNEIFENNYHYEATIASRDSSSSTPTSNRVARPEQESGLKSGDESNVTGVFNVFTSKQLGLGEVLSQFDSLKFCDVGAKLDSMSNLSHFVDARLGFYLSNGECVQVVFTKEAVMKSTDWISSRGNKQAATLWLLPCVNVYGQPQLLLRDKHGVEIAYGLTGVTGANNTLVNGCYELYWHDILGEFENTDG